MSENNEDKNGAIRERAVMLRTYIELGEVPEGLTSVESANARFREACVKLGLKTKEAREQIVREGRDRAAHIRTERDGPERLKPLLDQTRQDMIRVYTFIAAHDGCSEGEIYKGVFSEEKGLDMRVFNTLTLLQRGGTVWFEPSAPGSPRRYHIKED